MDASVNILYKYTVLSTDDFGKRYLSGRGIQLGIGLGIQLGTQLGIGLGVQLISAPAASASAAKPCAKARKNG